MILNTLADMLLDFDSNEDARVFRKKDKPTGDVGVDVKIAEFYATAAALQHQQPRKNQAPEHQLAVFFEQKAIDFLRSAVEAGFNNVNSLENNPNFENIKHQNGFVKLIDDLK